jgi:4-diphosphocytidyl-2-C-methyl-D-erythritol kinase
VQVDAYAKLNLTFEVLGKRDDGYHDVKTVMQTVELADRISFEPWPTLQVDCDSRELSGEVNLVWKAAQALARSRGILPRARIRIEKRIPVAMGLGGGSSDAAASLRALNVLWETAAPDEELAEIAGSIGSDVSFFLSGGTALAEGRGEIVSPLPLLPPFNLTLVFPDLVIRDKTRRMYSHLTPAHYSDGGITRRLVLLLTGGGFVVESIRGCVFNVFQDIAEWEFPVIGQMRRSVLERGGPELYLCGAGPAMFAIPSSETDHRTVAEALQPLGAGVYLVTTAGRSALLDPPSQNPVKDN